MLNKTKVPQTNVGLLFIFKKRIIEKTALSITFFTGGKMNEELKTVWPGRFFAGESVFLGIIDAWVIEIWEWFVPKGQVPIKYYDRQGNEKFKTVPPDRLERN